MPNDAADCRAGHRMMSRDMTCNPADGRALYATVSAAGKEAASGSEIAAAKNDLRISISFCWSIRANPHQIKQLGPPRGRVARSSSPYGEGGHPEGNQKHQQGRQQRSAAEGVQT
jgi:hypothetical protein